MWPPSDARTARQIAAALEAAVADGRLAAGERLPTARALARRLGLAPGTVHRAYGVAARRGLVSSRVGAGTFVRAADAERIDLATNRGLPLSADAAERLAAGLARIGRGRRPGPPGELDALAHGAYRETAAAWLAACGLARPPDRIRVVASMQHAIVALLAATVKRGETVACEALTYTGVRAAAGFLGVRLAPVALDAQGLLPDELERVCRRQRPRLLYLTPGVQAACGVCLPAGRRARLVELARRYDMLIVEEDSECALQADPPPHLGALAPERTYTLFDVDKPLLPGAQLGFCALPPAGDPTQVDSALRCTIGYLNPLWAGLLADWIRGGAAQADAAARAAALAERCTVVRELLRPGRGDRWELRVQERAHTAWLGLPPEWRAAAFEAAAGARGVRVASGEAFAVGHLAAPQGVRLALGAAEDIGALRTGLECLRHLLRAGPGLRR